MKVTLNHPHLTLNDLLRYKGQVFTGYIKTYKYYIIYYNYKEPDFYNKEDGKLILNKDKF